MAKSIRGTKPKAKASTHKKSAFKTRATSRSEPKSASGSKQEKVLGLLRQVEGATIAGIIKATGWQQHSVRGFFAGIVRKKLGLALESKKIDGNRIYRIVAAKSSKDKSKPESAPRQAT
jgi:hypothetical protein